MNSEGLSLTAKLFGDSDELVEQIINEKDPDKINDLTQLFKMSQAKKDVARTNRLSKLLEVIDDEVIMRFTSTPEAFDNDQLLKYMDVTQRTIYNVSDSINKVPTIQINNHSNEIHINNSGLDRSSRAKVLEAVNSILNSANVIDITPDKEEDK